MQAQEILQYNEPSIFDEAASFCPKAWAHYPDGIEIEFKKRRLRICGHVHNLLESGFVTAVNSKSIKGLKYSLSSSSLRVLRREFSIQMKKVIALSNYNSKRIIGDVEFDVFTRGPGSSKNYLDGLVTLVPIKKQEFDQKSMAICIFENNKIVGTCFFYVSKFGVTYSKQIILMNGEKFELSLIPSYLKDIELTAGYIDQGNW